MRAGWEIIESKSFVIPTLPPSKNKLHTILRIPNMPLQFKRSKEYERWLQESLVFIPLVSPLKDSNYFKIDTIFNYPFFHINKKHRRLDCHNFLEALCDAVSSKNGFDDSYIKWCNSEAYDNEREFIEVTLYQVAYKPEKI